MNGELRQDSNTARMIRGVAELVAFIGQTVRLEPGDAIATGTPLGGVMGRLSDPPRFLREGDEVVMEIERVVTLRNPVGGSP